jgi:hypothetical protein
MMADQYSPILELDVILAECTTDLRDGG